MSRRSLTKDPQRIVLIKSHSAGVGDILRSSAAWAALHRCWPEAELHLLFLTRWPGYPSESLIQGHYLLRSAHFLTLIEGRFAGMRGVGPKGWSTLLPPLRRLGREIQPDLIVDHEAHGIETSIAARVLRAQSPGAVTVGLAQVPGRGCLYDLAGPSLRRYAQARGLPDPMDYTERDFAALTALGIERNGQQITLGIGEDGRAWQTAHPRQPGEWRIGLNIGCGTSDAVPRRPNIDLLVEALDPSAFEKPFSLFLTGAVNEWGINEEFIRLYGQRWRQVRHIMNLAGTGSLDVLSGIIASCDVFVSGDSGPYHMAVALGTPTVALFHWLNLEAYHHVPHLTVLTSSSAEELMKAINHFIKIAE